MYEEPAVAGSSLLALIDDIATLLDDISVMTKVAAKKTAGVLGDDLAVNAERVTGVRAERELPVVWAVARGSFLNKLILVPAALLISTFLPWAVTPLLMLGGAYLCYEGFEKLAHYFLHRDAEDAAEHDELLAAVADPEVDLVAYERRKIKGAIRTDFILSAEIIVIALGTVQDATLATRIGVLSTIAVLMTVGVYGLVAGIVKLDDAGLYLAGREGESLGRRALRVLGRFLLRLAPWLMKSLGVLGTAAMFLVGGGILVHGLPMVYEWLHHLQELALGVGSMGGLLSGLVLVLFNGLFGVLAGGLVLGAVSLLSRLRRGSA
jgi:predicted DNA repair protein MutK